MTIGLISYSVAFVTFLSLSILLIISWRGRALGSLIILASALSTLWACISVLNEYKAVISIEILQLSELLRSLSWCFFLLTAIEKESGDFLHKSNLYKISIFFMLLLLGLAVTLTFPSVAIYIEQANFVFEDYAFITWIAVAIAGMALIEQLFRNSDTSQRWAIKFLCLGIGSIFAYDFYMYADALLFKRIDPILWQARGFINGIAVPLIAVSVARNPKYEVDIHVSRQVVFHTATLLGAGVYLLIMAVAGYFIRYYGGTWGGVLQTIFFVAAAGLLVSLLFSDKIRAKVRVFLSKHFFSYKYDYREQWQEFTRNLAEEGNNVPERIIRAIANLTESYGGMLWEKSPNGQLVLLERWQMPQPEISYHESLDSLAKFINKTGWVVDLDEYTTSPGLYENLQLPHWLNLIPNAWLLVPLMYRDDCLGFVLLKRSELHKKINWEDRDMLKMAGQQAATHLAQFQANKALMEAHQFDAFNRLSAYVVHDLKNILAQQSLLLSNAQKHKTNPAFIDDVFRTIENSVARMRRLMEQMREGKRGGNNQEVSLSELLRQVITSKAMNQPTPSFSSTIENANIFGDREQLLTVFAHLVQNAQEATPNNGFVKVTLHQDAQTALIDIEDSGSGMDEEFIRERLFKPFDTTKGLTGMGIGVFESREYIRSLGGEISVKSAPDSGTIFRITLPLSEYPTSGN